MASSPQAMAAQLATLRRHFLSRLPEVLSELETAWEDRRKQPNALEPLNLLHRLTHRLTGSGGTFGFPSISQSSRLLETQLKPLLELERPPDSTELLLLEQGLKGLRETIRTALAEGGVTTLAPAATPSPSPVFPSPAADTVPQPAGVAGKPGRYRILLVEDVEEQREALSVALAARGWEIIASADGLDGIRAALAESPDLIVSDVLMPGLTGYHLCRFLKNSPEHAGTPIVLLTALGESRDKFWGHHCGADRYFIKGGDPEELLGAVSELLEASACRRQQPRPGAGQWLGRSTVSEQVAGMMDRLLREATLREEIGKLGRSAASLSDFLGSSLELLSQLELFDAAAILLRFDDHLRVATWRLSPAERPAALELLTPDLPAPLPELVEWVDFESLAEPSAMLASHQTVALESGGLRFGTVGMIRRQSSPAFGAPGQRRLEAFCREFEEFAAVAWGREAVARKNRQLVELTEMKDRLSELLVHDVKNAAWAVSMTLDSLSTDRDLSERNRKALNEAHVGCRLLTEMMVSLLDIAKMEQTGIPIQPGPIDCNALAREVLELHEDRARKRGVEVRLELLPRAFGDAELVRRVLSNLLGNAVKHTLDGSIAIESPFDSSNVNNSEVLIAVRDTGPGIEERFLRILFEKYTQAERMRPGATMRGLPLDRGLGLYFCRMAVEAHGGRIWAESEPGVGSVFKFTLPADAAAYERHSKG